MREPSVSAGYASGLLEFAVASGADRGQLTLRSGLDPATLADPDQRVPFLTYVALMHVSKELAGDPALALHFGEAVAIERLSIIGLIGQASETMLDAFAQLNRYVRLVVDVGDGARDRFELAPAPGGPWVVDTRPHPNDFPELTESAFAQLACGPRRLGVPPFVRAVHVTHDEPPYRAEYERVFAPASIVFGSERNAMQIDAAVAAHPVGVLPRYVFGVLTDRADALLGELDSSDTTRGQVERLLMPVLHGGGATMESVAQRLGVSRRTLFRQLRTEGVTFEQVLDGLRHRLAVRYLRGSRVSINETAYLVGFSDPAAFSRAFKRWTGSSPRAAREGK